MVISLFVTDEAAAPRRADGGQDGGDRAQRRKSAPPPRARRRAVPGVLVVGRLLRREVLIHRGLKIQVSGEGDRVAEGQDLRRPEAAEAVLPIDPVEEIGKASPPERALWPPGRRLRIVYHERQRPGF